MKMLALIPLCLAAVVGLTNGKVDVKKELMLNLVDKLDGVLPQDELDKVLDVVKGMNDDALMKYAILHQVKPKVNRPKLTRAVEKELAGRPDLRKQVVRAINHMDSEALVAFAEAHEKQSRRFGDRFDLNKEPTEKIIKSVFDMDGNPMVDDDVVDKVDDVVDNVEDDLEKVEEKVEKVEGEIEKVEDKVEKFEDKVEKFEDKVEGFEDSADVESPAEGSKLGQLKELLKDEAVLAFLRGSSR